MFRSYMPRLHIQWLRDAAGEATRELDGSVAYVDVSGFTKLSERLARQGKVGAEKLTDVIGSSFSQLLGAAYGNGGSLLKFGGDALLLLFSGDDHAARACRAAIGMRRTLREIGRLETPGGKIALRMSVGIHSGSFDFFLVGSSHRELIVTGPAATETVAMESTAEAGEILVSRSTAGHLPARVLGQAKGPGILLRSEPHGLASGGESEPLADDAGLGIGIPLAVRQHLLSGGEDPEHRQATVAFVHFDGVDELLDGGGAGAVAQALSELVEDAQSACDGNGVTFLGTDIDRDGGKIILVAGAPSTTGHDEEQMLLAVRQIVEHDRVLPVRIGVNRGHVFAGDIGPWYRRTYTVMGDTVNLAARLMAAAMPGQILSTAGPLERSRTMFHAVALEPIAVKGKSRPVQPFEVGPVVRGRGSQQAGSGLPMVGRQMEMEALVEALGSARARTGRAVELVGGPGIGKSRLVEELRAGAQDLPVLAMACQLYESSTPYYAIRDLLRDLLGIGPSDRPEDVAHRLRDRVEPNDPDLLPWLPLLGIAMDVPIPGTPETDAIEQQFLPARLAEVAVRFLEDAVPTPTLLLFEDAHWMDEASGELLKSVVAAAAEHPWLILVVRREGDHGFRMPEAPHATTIRPGPLGEVEALSLAEAATETVPLPYHQLALIARRSGGNPLFLLELVAAAQAGGDVEALPDTVEAVLMARIDRLAPRDRTILRYASVLGPSFALSLLSAVLAEDTPGSEDPLWTRLSEFIELDELGTLRFRNALIRDAAYEGLAYRRRQDLHSRAGDAILLESGETQDEHAELLSIHFFHAERHAEAWRFARLAGDRAQAKYANAEAAAFFERALGVVRRLRDRRPDEVAAVLEALGDVRERVGEFTKAELAYRSARRIMAGDLIAGARLLLKEAWIPERLGRFSQGLRSISRGLKVLDGVEGEDAAKLRARLTVAYAAVRQTQGRHHDAIRRCRRAIDEAEAAGDKDALAHAYSILDWALVTLGRPDENRYAKMALAIYEDLGNLARQALVLNHLGAAAYLEGRWAEAVELYERGREAREKTGDPVNAAYGTANIAEIFSDQGRLEEAERLFRQAYRVWRAAGHRLTMAYARMQLGRVAMRSGRFDEALSLLQESGSDFLAMGDREEVVETNARIAECKIFRGEAQEALDLATEAFTLAGTMGGVGVHVPLLQRIQGLAFIQLGRNAEARSALDRSLEAARRRSAQFEVALTLRVLCHLWRLEGLDAAPLEAESDAILHGLGVVSADPLLPLPQLDPTSGT